MVSWLTFHESTTMRIYESLQFDTHAVLDWTSNGFQIVTSQTGLYTNCHACTCYAHAPFLAIRLHFCLYIYTNLWINHMYLCICFPGQRVLFQHQCPWMHCSCNCCVSIAPFPGMQLSCKLQKVAVVTAKCILFHQCVYTWMHAFGVLGSCVSKGHLLHDLMVTQYVWFAWKRCNYDVIHSSKYHTCLHTASSIHWQWDTVFTAPGPFFCTEHGIVRRVY